MQLHLGYMLALTPGAASADISQSIGRGMVSQDPKEYPTMMPKCMVWDTKLARLISGWEGLRFIGFDKRMLDFEKLESLNFTDSNMEDLAGNAFAGHIVTAILLSCIVHLPWHRYSAKKFATIPAATIPAVVQSEQDADSFVDMLYEMLGP